MLYMFKNKQFKFKTYTVIKIVLIYQFIKVLLLIKIVKIEIH